MIQIKADFMPFKIGRFCAILTTMQNNDSIQHVSDTALWVATFRARESEKKNPLFRDPLARRLVGDRGEKIAKEMPASKRVEWTVILRTVMIDRLILELIAQGADTVLNLGAGLDTRPYRMPLPSDFRWIEVDYPHLMDYKENLLRDEKPVCKFERVKLDLADEALREQLFSRIAAESKKVIVLTEGVTPYLSNEAVASLAQALKAQPNFKYWITDYIAPWLKNFFLKHQRRTKLQNTPFIFWPTHWESFFEGYGWKIKQMNYMTDEGERQKLKMPMPLYQRLITLIASPARRKAMKKMSGYALLESK